MYVVIVIKDMVVGPLYTNDPNEFIDIEGAVILPVEDWEPVF